MKVWKAMNIKDRISLILSVFQNGEELTASEIAERLKGKGVEVSPHAVSGFIWKYMEFKYLRKIRRRDPRVDYISLRTFWRRIQGGKGS